MVGLPASALMVWLGVFWLIFFAWLRAKNKWADFFRSIAEHPRLVLVFISLFFLAGLISLFVGGFSVPKLGQSIVLFIQPIGTYFIARYLVYSFPKSKDLLVRAAFIFLAAVGSYAVAQYFTLIGLPEGWWGNSAEPKRAIGFFTHPNSLALFITPLLAFLLPKVSQALDSVVVSFRHKKFGNVATWFVLISWILGAAGLLLSLSRGGWLGLIAALAVFVVLSGKKMYLYASLVGIVAVASVIIVVPNLRYRVLLPFYGEKSSVARLSLWQTGSKMIQDSPVIGKGLLGFTANWEKYNDDPGLQSYPAPHNIFLNFWVDTGLLGLVSFISINIYLVALAVQKRKIVWMLSLVLFVIAMFVHGQIDVPYLKNDLALLYWLLFGAFYAA